MYDAFFDAPDDTPDDGGNRLLSEMLEAGDADEEDEDCDYEDQAEVDEKNEDTSDSDNTTMEEKREESETMENEEEETTQLLGVKKKEVKCCDVTYMVWLEMSVVFYSHQVSQPHYHTLSLSTFYLLSSPSCLVISSSQVTRFHYTYSRLL